MQLTPHPKGSRRRKSPGVWVQTRPKELRRGLPGVRAGAGGWQDVASNKELEPPRLDALQARFAYTSPVFTPAPSLAPSPAPRLSASVVALPVSAGFTGRPGTRGRL